MRGLRILVSIVGLVLLASTALAGNGDDGRLDTLFDELKTASSAGEARVIETAIWNLWTVTGKEDTDALMARGISAMESGDFDGALTAFDRLVVRDPQFAEAWNKRATVHYMMGDFEASVADIERTLAHEPRHFGALSGLGLIFMAVGNDEAALRVFEKALSIDPYLQGPAEFADEIRRKLEGRAI